MSNDTQFQIGDTVRIEMYNRQPGRGVIQSGLITYNIEAKRRQKGLWYQVKGEHDGEDYSGLIHAARLRKLALVLILVMFTTPIARASDISAQAFMDARADAERDVNTHAWLAWGCCTGLIGLPLSYASAPEIPIERIMGKPPEYVHFYMHEYARKTQEIQSHYAGIGSFVATGAMVLFSYFVLKSANPLGLEFP